MAEKVRLVACARNYRPCFRENQLNARFLLSENERFGLVFVKTGSINSGTGLSNEYQRQQLWAAWAANAPTSSASWLKQMGLRTSPFLRVKNSPAN